MISPNETDSLEHQLGDFSIFAEFLPKVRRCSGLHETLLGIETALSPVETLLLHSFLGENEVFFGFLPIGAS